jgi:hypothetical protein
VESTPAELLREEGQALALSGLGGPERAAEGFSDVLVAAALEVAQLAGSPQVQRERVEGVVDEGRELGSLELAGTTGGLGSRRKRLCRSRPLATQEI